MALNSKREQIILSDIAIIEAVSSISHTERTLFKWAKLQELSSKQFPACAIVGRMPVPRVHRNTRCRIDQIVSTLKVDVYTFIEQNNEAQVDADISNIADDLFAALYSDQTRGGLVIKSEVDIKEGNDYWAPYGAFQITVTHEYVHGTEGI